MNVFRIMNKANGQFYMAGLWRTSTKDGKIWAAKGRVQSALAGTRPENAAMMEIIEYELVEKKRYVPIPKDRDSWRRTYTLVETPDQEITQKIPVPDSTSPDWSKI